jgi:hypothetical protein
MYKNDVIKLDWQDDGAAYRTFCSANLKQLVSHNYQLKFEDKGFFVYLFIIDKYVFK